MVPSSQWPTESEDASAEHPTLGDPTRPLPTRPLPVYSTYLTPCSAEHMRYVMEIGVANQPAGIETLIEVHQTLNTSLQWIPPALAAHGAGGICAEPMRTLLQCLSEQQSLLSCDAHCCQHCRWLLQICLTVPANPESLCPSTCSSRLARIHGEEKRGFSTASKVALDPETTTKFRNIAMQVLKGQGQEVVAPDQRSGLHPLAIPLTR